MKDWLRKVTGLTALEQAAKEAAANREAEEQRIIELKKEAEEAREAAEKAAEEAELAKLSPKERATRKKEPWISVLDVKLNEENIRNGFFELDWNEYFIQELIQNGYGVENDPQEEIVDRWFRDIIYQMLDEEGLDRSRGSGYINVVPISKGKSQVS